MAMKQSADSILCPPQTRKATTHSHWILFVLFYAICANIPYWAASHWMGLLPIGWFCVEYAVVGLLALYIPRIFAAVLLVLVINADLLSGVSKTYFLLPVVCLENFRTLSDFNGARIFAAAAVLILMLLMAAIAALFPAEPIHGRHRLYAALCLIAFAVTAVCADYAAIVHETGHVPRSLRAARPVDTDKSADYGSLWFSRYPFLRLIRNQGYFGGFHTATQLDAAPMPSATSLVLQSIGPATGKAGQQTPNVVLVLLESWGLSTDASMRNSLVAPYAQPELLARYQVVQGTVPFYGTTVGGEARELCSSSMGFQIVDASAHALQNCLPDRLASLGYHNVSVHGMDGHVFERATWYKSIGFQELLFRDQFRQQGLPDCVGAFRGTCDTAIAGWIGNRLESRSADPEFIYWVTLNSHLPVPIPSGLPDGASCTVTPMLAQKPALCSWYQFVANVHHAVYGMAMDNLARPTLFVIVGDHTPPFVDPTLHSQFSSTDVPYVVLIPRRN
jgi:hypothetical protein